MDEKDRMDIIINFNYQEAKEDMINMFAIQFDPEGDDGIIYESTGTGIAKPVFNYRAYLNGEPDAYEAPAKENHNIKVLFKCPKCRGQEFGITMDEDEDVIVFCKTKGCKHVEIIIR